MPFKLKKKSGTLKLGTTITDQTGNLTPIQEGTLQYGTNINPASLEIWYKDENGVVTKTQEKPTTGTIVPVRLKKPTDTFALNHPTNFWYDNRVTNEVIDRIADDLVIGGSEWISVHMGPFKTSRYQYVFNIISRLKAKGLKVHFRCHDETTEGNGGQIYNSGTATGGTLTSLVDSSKNWVNNEWKGYVVRITGGPAKSDGLVVNGKNIRGYYIKGNTNNTLFVEDFNENFILPQTSLGNGSKYEIFGEKLMDNYFLDRTRGYYFRCKDLAFKTRDLGVDSFSVANEFTASVKRFHTNSIFPSDEACVIEQQKLVKYIKEELTASGRSSFPYGVTTTDGFWMVEHFAKQGLGPMDYYEYTAYEEDTSAMYTYRKAIDAFGSGKVSFGEFSLSGSGSEEFERGQITSNQDYADKINRRVKWAKYLGIRSIFRWELWDTNGKGDASNNGFGYMAGTEYMSNGQPEVPYGIKSPWFEGSYLKSMDPKITDWSVGFDMGRLPVKINNSPTLNLGDKFTIQLWIHSARGAITVWTPKPGGGHIITPVPSTLISKAGSYEFGFENGKVYGKLWTTDQAGAKVKSTVDLKTDRWVHLAYTYSGNLQALYMDGVQIANSFVTGNILNNQSPILIGSPVEQLPNDSNFTFCRLQDFEICNSVLYPQSFVPPTTQPNNSTAICRLLANEGSGTTLSDSTGKQNNGVMLGSDISQADWFIGKYDKLVDLNTYKTIGALPNYKTQTFKLNSSSIKQEKTINFPDVTTEITVNKIEAKIITGSTGIEEYVVKFYKLILPNTLQEFGTLDISPNSNIDTQMIGNFIPLAYSNGDKISAKLFKKNDMKAVPAIGTELIINILYK
jgi:Concanavalin A-like lectin/glucanases superfamily